MKQGTHTRKNSAAIQCEPKLLWLSTGVTRTGLGTWKETKGYLKKQAV